MDNLHNSEQEDEYWSQRYKDKRTGWDIGYPSTPIREYIDQLTDKEINVLIPGAGNAYEAEYMFSNGFGNIDILDISKIPLSSLKQRLPDFPDNQLIHGNFFEHDGQYDLILEQTFFCSFPPTKETREHYAKQMATLLNPGGKLVGVWFDFPLKDDFEKRPFGGDQEEYVSYLNPYFNVQVFESCFNSIPERAGSELFGIFKKR